MNFLEIWHIIQLLFEKAHDVENIVLPPNW